MSALPYGCTNVFHDEVDCLSSDLPRDEWCEPCKRVEAELETVPCKVCGGDATFSDDAGPLCDECAVRLDNEDFLYARRHGK